MTEYTSNQVKSTTKTLQSALDNLAEAKTVAVNKIPLPPNVQKNIEEVRNTANVSVLFPEIRTWTSLKTINLFLNSMREIVNIAFVMLFLAVQINACSILSFRHALFCVHIYGHWLDHLQTHLCCVASISYSITYGTLSTSKDVTFQTVSNVNKFITNVANKNGTGPNSFSQSGPLVPALCNPYHSDMTDRKCITGEVDFSNADAVHLCSVHSSGLFLQESGGTGPATKYMGPPPYASRPIGV
uniref:Uncharacterized protein n=1 Tax=Quercus lobata TaxID=97700 RepID=A0A7N2LPS5_QUELO